MRYSKLGYKRYSPDLHRKYNIIPSGNITMRDVDFPVYGIDNLGNQQMMYPGNDYTFPGNEVLEIPQFGKGGLKQWFDEKWVDIKTGKPCGRSGKDKRGRPYPACRPSRRVNSTTPKTASELSAAEKAKFKRKKKSGKRIDYNHKRAFGGSLPLAQFGGRQGDVFQEVDTYIKPGQTIRPNWTHSPVSVTNYTFGKTLLDDEPRFSLSLQGTDILDEIKYRADAIGSIGIGVGNRKGKSFMPAGENLRAGIRGQASWQGVPGNVIENMFGRNSGLDWRGSYEGEVGLAYANGAVRPYMSIMPQTNVFLNDNLSLGIGMEMRGRYDKNFDEPIYGNTDTGSIAPITQRDAYSGMGRGAARFSLNYDLGNGDFIEGYYAHPDPFYQGSMPGIREMLALESGQPRFGVRLRKSFNKGGSLPTYQTQGEVNFQSLDPRLQNGYNSTDATYVAQNIVDPYIATRSETQRLIDENNQQTISSYVEPSTAEKLVNRLANPFTTAGYIVRGQQIPDRVAAKDNVFDMASDVINPVAYLEAGNDAINAFGDGDVIGGALSTAGALPFWPGGLFKRGSSSLRNTVIQPGSRKLERTLYAPNKVYGRGMPSVDAEMTTRFDLVEQYNARNNAYHTVNITDDLRNNEYLRERARVYGYNPDSDRDLALFLGSSPGGTGRRTGYEDLLPEGYDFLYSGNNPIQTLNRYGDFSAGSTPYTTKFRLFNDNTSMLSDRDLFERIQALDGVNTNRPDFRMAPISTFYPGDDISKLVQGNIVNTNTLHVPGLNQTNIMVGRVNTPVRQPVDIRAGSEMNGWPSIWELGTGEGTFTNPSDYDFYFKKKGGQLPKAQGGIQTKGFDDWDEYQYRNAMYNDSLMAADISDQTLAYLSQTLDPSVASTREMLPVFSQDDYRTVVDWGKLHDKPAKIRKYFNYKKGQIRPANDKFASDVMEMPSFPLHKFTDIDIVKENRIPLSFNDYTLINDNNAPVSGIRFYSDTGRLTDYDYLVGPGVYKGNDAPYYADDPNDTHPYDYLYVPEANWDDDNDIIVWQYQRPSVQPVFTGTKPSATKTVAALPTAPAPQPAPLVKNTPKQQISKTVKATPLPTMDIQSMKLNQQTGEWIYETSEGTIKRKQGPENAAFIKENRLAIDNYREARANKKAGGELPKAQEGGEFPTFTNQELAMHLRKLVARGVPFKDMGTPVESSFVSPGKTDEGDYIFLNWPKSKYNNDGSAEISLDYWGNKGSGLNWFGVPIKKEKPYTVEYEYIDPIHIDPWIEKTTLQPKEWRSDVQPLEMKYINPIPEIYSRKMNASGTKVTYETSKGTFVTAKDPAVLPRMMANLKSQPKNALGMLPMLDSDFQRIFVKQEGGTHLVGEELTNKINDTAAEHFANIEREQNEKFNRSKAFVEGWTNSLMHDQMLSDSLSGDKERIARYKKGRLQNIQTMPDLNIQYQQPSWSEAGAASLSTTGRVIAFPNGFNLPTPYTHEITHSSDRPNQSNGRLIPESDINLMHEYFVASDSPFRQPYDEYVAKPQETRARLMEVRDIARQKGIYDPYNEKLSKSAFDEFLLNHIDKDLKSDKDFRESPLIQLMQAYTEDQIFDMLNTISLNSAEEDTLTYAKNGKSLPSYQKDGQVRDEIVSLSTSDPRYAEYYNRLNDDVVLADPTGKTAGRIFLDEVDVVADKATPPAFNFPGYTSAAVQDGIAQQTPFRFSPEGIAAEKSYQEYQDYINSLPYDQRPGFVPYEPPTISEYIPPSTAEWWWDKISNPMTSLGYVMRGQTDIMPDRVGNQERNTFDYAIDLVNPATYINTVGDMYENLSEGDIVGAGLDAITLTPIVPTAAKQVKKAIPAVKNATKNIPAKINPNYYNPNMIAKGNPDIMYRQIGKDAYQDFANSGLLRTKAEITDNPVLGLLETQKEIKDVLRFNKESRPFQYRHGTDFRAPFFSRGKTTGIRDGGADYLIQTRPDRVGPNNFYSAQWNILHGNNPPVVGGFGIMDPMYRSADNFDVFKKSWWHGYKPVKQLGGSLPSYQDKGEVKPTRSEKVGRNEIPENKDLFSKYVMYPALLEGAAFMDWYGPKVNEAAGTMTNLGMQALYSDPRTAALAPALHRGTNEWLFENVRPVAYPTILTGITEVASGMMGYNAPPSLDADGDYTVDEEAWRRALGLPTTSKYIVPSQYKPSTAEDPNAKYYTISPSVLDRQKLIQEAQARNMQVGDKAYLESMAPYIVDGYMSQNEFSEIDPLQRFKMSVGEDDKGRYLSIYDKYDLSGPANELIYPYEFYDRVYYKRGGRVPRYKANLYR